AGRIAGYRAALRDRGLLSLPGMIVPGLYEDAGGYRAMQRLLQLKEPPDGVFCFNDPVAAGAVKAILQAGLRVPEDIAIVGVGNVHYSDQLRVPLSTVDQSSLQTGREAAELLLRLVE